MIEIERIINPYYFVSERVLRERMPVTALIIRIEEDPESLFMQYILHEVITAEVDPSRAGEVGWVLHELWSGKYERMIQLAPLGKQSLTKTSYWKDF